MTMTETERLAKNQRIKETGAATRARRAKMDCRTYHLKLSPNKTLKKQTRKTILRSEMAAKRSHCRRKLSNKFSRRSYRGLPC